ncbi:MAG: hypothetical protein ACRD6I_18880 [Candidatus Acidiferrales bacterium]
MIRSAALVCVLSVLMCAVTAKADSQQAAASRDAEAVQKEVEALQAELAARRSSSLTITFPGGTVGEYAAMLRDAMRANGETVNIMVQPGAESVPLPRLELVDVSLESALQLLQNHQGRNEAGLTTLGLDVVRGQGAPVYVVSSRQIFHGPQSRSKPDNLEEIVHVWNVNRILRGGIKADDMLTAIETALSLVRSSAEPAEIRFHEATALVIARGTVEQIQTMEQVIEQLGLSARQSAEDKAMQLELDQARKALAEMEAQRGKMEEAIQVRAQLEREREMMRHDLEEMRRRSETAAQDQQRRIQELQELSTRREIELHEMQKRLQEQQQKRPGGA